MTEVFDDWLLTPHRAAVHLPTGTAVIADLHLAYDQARRRSGEAVPAFTLRHTLAGLRAVFESAPVRRLVIAGNLIESRVGIGFVRKLLQWVSRRGIELSAIVPGNHDRGLVDPSLPLQPEGFMIGDWRIVHGDGRLPRGHLVLGHFHPCFSWRGVKVPCYLAARDRLILPAFSRDAAGVNVLGSRTWGRYRCFPIAGRRVLDFGQLSKAARAMRHKPEAPAKVATRISHR